MNGQTIVQYGDVTFYRCELNDFDQRPVMDETGTDLKYWAFRVTLTGYVVGGSCQRHDVYGGNVQDGSASDAMMQIRWRLLPRQVFQMAMGCNTTIGSGRTVLFALPMSSFVNHPRDLQGSVGRPGGATGMSYFDVTDGPRCHVAKIIRVAADNVFKVQVTFELTRVQCADDDTSAGNTTGVLSNRWSSTDSLDTNLRCSRIHRGILEIATSQFSPHWFRYLVVPPLANGFRRDHMLFTATEDGRKLAYTIVDTEIAISAPPPARKWSVQHTEAILNNDGIKGHGSCSVTLEGDSNVDKTQLILLGLNIITAKLVGTTIDGPFPRTIVFNDISITDFTGDVQAVHLSCNVTTALAGVDAIFIPRQDGFRKIISAADLPAFAANYDPRTSAGGRDGELPEYQGPASLVGIFRCYVQSPCNNVHSINEELNVLGDNDNDLTDEGPKAPIDAVVVSELGEVPAIYYSNSQNDSIYTYYQCESTYITKFNRAAMPVANEVYSGSQPVDTSDATQFVQLSRPQTLLRVRIAAERTGAWPEFPDPEEYGSFGYGQTQYATVQSNTGGGQISYDPPVEPIKMKCLSAKLLGGTGIATMTGYTRFRARMEMLFGLSRRPTQTEILKFGHDPWSIDDMTGTGVSGIGTLSRKDLTGTVSP